MISQTGRHAIGALIELARLPAGNYEGAAVVAERIGAPGNYLGKLLQSLAVAGLLDSRKGPGGGFRLARLPEQVTLLDVLDPLENLKRWDGCFLGLPICSDDSACPMHKSWKNVRESYLNLLATTTLADVLRKPEGWPVAAAAAEAGPGGAEPGEKRKKP